MSNKGIVPTMIGAAAKATIETHPLRRNISVLEGAGGNIAVLTGKDGKLLIDAGFIVSKPRLTEALNKLSSDPITQLINTDARRGMAMDVSSGTSSGTPRHDL